MESDPAPMRDAERPLLMVFPMDLASHYLRSITLCRKLEQSFRIEIADSEEYRQFVKEARLETFRVARFERDLVKESAAGFDFSWLNERNLRQIYSSQVETIKERQPHAVLGDTSFTLKMAAEKAGVRFVSLVNSYMTKYYGLWRGVPRAHPGYKFSKTLPSNLFEIIAREMEYRALHGVHEPFRSMRRSERLSPTEYLLDELEGDLNLVCDLPDLFPLRGAPPSYRCVGPLFHAGGGDEPELLSFLEGPAKNILVTTGSSGEWKHFSFLEDERFGKYRFVLTGNGGGVISPPNSISKPFVNNDTIMSKIDLVICHGGNGTIYQALSHGIPVLCIPANFECEWNSYRIQASGLGEVIEGNWSIRKIGSKMDAWIGKRGAPNFRSIGAEIAGYLNAPLDIAPLLK